MFAFWLFNLISLVVDSPVWFVLFFVKKKPHCIFFIWILEFILCHSGISDIVILDIMLSKILVGFRDKELISSISCHGLLKGEVFSMKRVFFFVMK